MTGIDALINQPAARAIAAALVQFIWQGALIGALTALALAALRRSAPDVRYVVASIGMALMLTMPIVTAWQAWDPGAAERRVGRGAAPIVDRGDLAAFDRTVIRQAPVDAHGRTTLDPIASASSNAADGFIPLFFVTWLAGVSLLSLRLITGWLWVQRMKSHAAVAVAGRWQAAAARLARRMHISRHVRLLQSAMVEVPTVIGWLKPVVLLPASALAGLSTEQLEAILAHELAHIRRHDYLVNLLQTLVETLLFYHPAVWWVSSRIRIEREHCCDDLAVSLCGDRYEYARALAELEALRQRTGRLALAATGGSLLQRVRRLVGAPSHAGRGPGWLAGATAVVVLALITGTAIGTDALTSGTSVVSQQQATTPRDQSTSSPVSATAAAAPAMTPALTASAQSSPQPASPAPAKATAARDAVAQPSIPLPAELADQVRALEENAKALAAAAKREKAAIASAEDAARAGEASSAVATAAAQATADHVTTSSREHQSQGNFVWSNGRDKLTVDYKGQIEFSDDDTDVTRLSPGGWLRIKDAGWLGSRAIEFSADESGRIVRRFWIGGTEHPFDPDGRKWLSEALPRFIRQTGIGAAARVARILKAKGPSGVLAEISLINGSWAKRIYFSELLKTNLDPQTSRQVLDQAGREIDSDFELASLLIGASDRLLVDDATRRAYFDAARSIGSDFEMRRVYSSALKRGAVTPPILAGVLDASTAIDSDFEQASLLIQIAALQPLDATTRAPFFKALATVHSDFEHRRVLTALAQRTDLTPETVSAMVESAAGIGSDFEQASLLLEIARQRPIDGTLRAPFFRVVDTIDSSFERGRVLQAAARRPDVSAETTIDILRAVKPMSSSFEASQILRILAEHHTLNGEARDLYVDIAAGLGDFEQGRVLSALVKAERRK